MSKAMKKVRNSREPAKTGSSVKNKARMEAYKRMYSKIRLNLKIKPPRHLGMQLQFVRCPGVLGEES